MNFKLIDICQRFFSYVLFNDENKLLVSVIEEDNFISFENIIATLKSVEKYVSIKLYIGNSEECLLVALCQSKINIWNLHDLEYNYKNNQNSINIHTISLNGKLCNNFVLCDFKMIELFIGTNSKEVIVISMKKNLVSDEIYSIRSNTGILDNSFNKFISPLVAWNSILSNLIFIGTLMIDNSLIIWRLNADDDKTIKQVYCSSLLSVNPWNEVIKVKELDFIIVGSTHGEVIILGETHPMIFNILWRLNLSKMDIYKTVTENTEEILLKKPTLIQPHINNNGRKEWSKVDDFDTTDFSLALSDECQCSLNHFASIDLSSEKHEYTLLRQIIKYIENYKLVFIFMSTYTGLFILNANSMMPFYFHKWSNILQISSGIIRLFINKNHIYFYETTNDKLFMVNLQYLFVNSDVEIFDTIDLMTKNEILPDSVLNRSIRPISQPKKSKSSDKPVTFKSKIKSSGYGQEMKRKMFEPITNNNKKETKNNQKFNISNFLKEYQEIDIKKNKLIQNLQIESKTSINSINVSNRNSKICAFLSNGTCQIFNPHKSKMKILNCDNEERIFSSSWSLEDKYLQSTNINSIDIWSISTLKRLFSINRSNLGTKLNSTKYYFSDSCFYFLDKFILSTYGSYLILWNYVIDESKSDINTYSNNSYFKSVYQWCNPNNSNILVSKSINHFYSYMVILGTTNNDLILFDLNSSKIVEEKYNCHDKKINGLSINQGSVYSTLSESQNYNCFASSCENNVKLWDVRINVCIQSFSKIINNSRYCNKIEFLPCGRYLCCGIADGITMYDIRKCAFNYDFVDRKSEIIDFACDSLENQLYASTRKSTIQQYSLLS